MSNATVNIFVDIYNSSLRINSLKLIPEGRTILKALPGVANLPPEMSHSSVWTFSSSVRMPREHSNNSLLKVTLTPVRSGREAGDWVLVGVAWVRTWGTFLRLPPAPRWARHRLRMAAEPGMAQRVQVTQVSQACKPPHSWGSREAGRWGREGGPLSTPNFRGAGLWALALQVGKRLQVGPAGPGAVSRGEQARAEIAALTPWIIWLPRTSRLLSALRSSCPGERRSARAQG